MVTINSDYEVILSRFLTSRKSFTSSKYWQPFGQKSTLHAINNHLISDSIHNCNLYQLNFYLLKALLVKILSAFSSLIELLNSSH